MTHGGGAAESAQVDPRPSATAPDMVTTLRSVRDRHQASDGHFAYSPEQLESLIACWQQLADEYTEDIRFVTPLATMLPPGTDHVSETWTAQVNATNKALLDSLIARRDYCRAEADRCRRVRDGAPPGANLPANANSPVRNGPADFPHADLDETGDPDETAGGP